MTKYHIPIPVSAKYATYNLPTSWKAGYDGEYPTEPRECVEVELTGQDYCVCWDTVISSSEKTDAFGKAKIYRGMVEEYRGKDLKSVYGYMGEVAWAKLNPILKVDITYYKHGDKQDFIYKGDRTDIKIARPSSKVGKWKCSIAGPSIVAGKSSGYVKEILDLYIVGFVWCDDISNRYSKIVIAGSVRGDELRNRQWRTTKNDRNTSNFDICYNELHPIRDLLE